MEVEEQSVAAAVGGLSPEEVAREGDGPGEPEKPEKFVGMDGEEVERPKLRPGRPRVKPAIQKPAEKEVAADGEVKPEEVPPEQRAAPERGRPGEQDYRKLAKPGETDEETLQRLWQENRGRAANEYRHRQDLETRLEQVTAHLERQQQLVEPLLRKQWREAQEERQRLEAAAIPDAVAQPEEYRTYLAEETLRRQIEWEQKTEAEKQQAREAWEKQQAQDAHFSQLAAVDEGIAAEVQGVAADPELGQAYQTSLWATARQFAMAFPDASDAQIEELTFGSHLLEMRSLFQRGISPRDYYRQQAAIFREAASRLTPAEKAAVAAVAAVAPGNGNGSLPAEPKKAAGSPTAERVAKEAAKAKAAAAVSSGGGPGRAGGIPGQVLDPSNFESEDDYLAWALAQPKGETEKILRQQLGRPARR